MKLVHLAHEDTRQDGGQPHLDGLDPDLCYRAVLSRDPRFDGRFFTAVTTTSIYCRPICPARTPKRQNVRFYACAAAAEAAGFRPCRRCRPEAAPGTPPWLGSLATVSRAMRLIGEGALDESSVPDLARCLGVGPRHLSRLFQRHLGASPIAVALTRRVHFARRLIVETPLPMTEIALGVGFASIRRFNDAMRGALGQSPSEIRRKLGGHSAGQRALELRLAYRPPYDWDSILQFLSKRALPGVEEIDAHSYRRTFCCGAGEQTGIVSVVHVPEARSLVLAVEGTTSRELFSIVARVRRLFDLGADPLTIDAQLARDPALAPLVAERPGLRVPGAWDGFEVAVRTILGQQVTVRAATTLAGRLVAALGQPLANGGQGRLTHVFPDAATIAKANLVRLLPLQRSRADAIRALASAVARGELSLDVPRDLPEAIARLRRLPGIGEWTAQCIAMRALGEPDAFPAGDLGVRQALAAGGVLPSETDVLRRAEAWRPWRAYAARHLWTRDRTPAATAAT
jgi:AraC family transcriptional regulator of adaptative response / DNA-3-methyladenine glycosylase II